MTYWTIKSTSGEVSTEKSLADWGVEGVRLTFANQQAAAMSFQVPGEPFDTADLFAFESAIVLYKDRVRDGDGYAGGTVWFRGTIFQTPRHLQPGGEAHSYEARDAWQWLEELVFHQDWLFNAGGQPTSDLIINYGVTVKEQVVAILKWAIAQGAPIADPDAHPTAIDELTRIPASQVRDCLCGELLRDQLKMSPDTVAYLDHSADPAVFHVHRYASCAEQTAVVDGLKLESAEITPRHDLVLPAVVMNYVTTIEVDGVAKISLAQQKSPSNATGLERRALVHTFDLNGPKITHVSESLVCETINATHGSTVNDATRIAWWKARIAALADTWVQADQIAEFKIIKEDGTILTTENDIAAFLTAYPRALVEGNLSDWLYASKGFTSQRCQIRAVAKVSVLDPSAEVINEDLNIAWECRATNAATGDYDSISTYEEGEDPPVVVGGGQTVTLAEYLYSVHQVLHYDGSINLTEQEVAGAIRPGHRLNLSGGTGRFAAMSALVQSVTEDIDGGATSITFGPPNHLGPSDILEWLRAFRTRRLWTNPATQTSGNYAADQAVESGSKGVINNATAVPDKFHRLKVVGTNSGVLIDINPDPNLGMGITNIYGGYQTLSHQLTIGDPNSGGSVVIAVADCNGMNLTAREITVWENCVEKRMMVIGTATYSP